MTRLSLTSTALNQVAADALIIGVARKGRSLVVAPGAEAVDKALKKRLEGALQSLGATGKAGEVTRLATLGATEAPTLVAVGLGDAPARGERYDAEAIRRAAGAAVRALAGTRRVATGLAAVNGDGSAEDLRAVAEGLALGGYAFRRYRNASKADNRAGVGSAAIVVKDAKDKATKTVVDRAAVIAEAVERCRDLVNTPAADLHPADLAAAAVELCGEAGCEVEVLDEKALAAGGFGGILGVGQGAANPPRLVRIAYSGAGAGSSPAVHLVGKGITFDTGGLSLKPSTAMEWMKADMGGAASVITTLWALGKLGAPVNVVGWLAIAENMPSGTAIRPSDVLTMYGGKTVEVLNTDAEGRLVMADAIVRAAEEKPAAIVDIATLTGAALVALGSRVYAVMANDDELREDILNAAERAGEQAWPMPLPQELRKSLDSDIADIANMGDRNGGMLVAGLFLRDFVPNGTSWAHLDVAGPAWNEGEAFGYTPKGGTGVPVRTLVEWLSGRAEERSSG
ncbi:MAG TPA: leucyl aminopeptidase [Mycobacteriales bacterium]|nr:leucyl aminopeptidase [Mycobacteriales bacterium]